MKLIYWSTSKKKQVFFWINCQIYYGSRHNSGAFKNMYYRSDEYPLSSWDSFFLVDDNFIKIVFNLKGVYTIFRE